MLLFDRALQILFPPSCVLCHSRTSWLCQSCAQLADLTVSIKMYPCRELPIYIANQDHSQALSKLLFAWKYQRYFAAGRILQDLWLSAFKQLNLPLSEVLLVPIPIHWFKKWQRGFNQAEMLYALAQEKMKLVSAPLLKRIIYTKSQVGLTKTERYQNLQSAFQINRHYKNLPKQKCIVLVDDIVTSGTTLVECSQVLREAGFHHILALVLHRGTH